MKRLLSLTAPTLLLAAALAGCGGSNPAADTTASSGQPAGGSPGSSGSASAPATNPTTPSATRKAASTTSTTATTSSSAGTGSTSSACTAAKLSLSFLGSQGAAGHGVLGFALRNTSGSTCHTYGYPGVQFLSSGGQALPTHPTHSTTDLMGTTKLERLTVSPGATVSFRLTVSHVANSPSACVTAAAVQVIPPDDTSSLKVTVTGGADECNGDVGVSPLQAGDSAYPAGGQ